MPPPILPQPTNPIFWMDKVTLLIYENFSRDTYFLFTIVSSLSEAGVLPSEVMYVR